jgi:hypothetical protein
MRIQQHEIVPYVNFINNLGVDLNETAKVKGSKAVLDSFYDNLSLFRRIQLIEKIQKEIKNNLEIKKL